MASGAQHYRMAEELLEKTDRIQRDDYEDFDAAWANYVAEAQVHATLALAAANADALDDRWLTEETSSDWSQATAADPEADR